MIRLLYPLTLLFLLSCHEVEPLAEPPADEPDVAEPEPSGIDLVGPVPAGEVRAGVIDDPAALLPGVKADGRVGDIKMMNQRVSFVIETAGPARGGYRYNGATVVDALPAGATDGDTFGEVWNTWNLHCFRPEDVEVVSDGSDGVAHVRFTGDLEIFWWAWSFLSGIAGGVPTDLGVVVDYRLRPGTSHLERDVTLTNPADRMVTVPLPLVFSNQGDGMTTWHRGEGFDFEFGTVDALMVVGRDVGHAVVPIDRQFEVILDYSDVVVSAEPLFILQEKESATFSNLHVVTSGGSAALEAEVARLLGNDADVAARIEGTVTLPPSAAPDSGWVVVRGDGAPVALAPIASDGAFGLELPAGSWALTAWVPDHAPSTGVVVEVADSETAEVALEVPASGTVHVTVESPNSEPVEGRVMLVAEDGTPTPYAPSDVRIAPKGAWAWGSFGKTSAVGYAIGGEVTLEVPPGAYRAIGSRGFSYEIDETDVTVTASETTEATLVLERAVDTTGWVSADFHIHALRSPDSDTPYPVRARQSVAEDLELPMLTEHVQIGNMTPDLEALGLDDRVIGLPAQEVTTFEYGHFNTFPLEERPEDYNRGAVFPYDKQPPELFEAIRDQSEGDEIIQVNHPRGSGMGAYFSWAGLDRKDLSVDKEEGWSTNWDAVEVFNGGCGGGDPLEDWIALTNGGVLKTLAAGSDSHRENDPVGMPRNWIRLTQGDVRDDSQAFVDAVRDRRMFASCGPFVRFESADGAHGLGGRAPLSADGSVAFRLVVEAPSWIALSEARLLRNGELVDVVPIEEVAGGVRLDVELSDTPTADAWYVVDVVGTGNLLPVSSHGPPRAYTNPIEVDADGDGDWTPPGV